VMGAWYVLMPNKYGTNVYDAAWIDCRTSGRRGENRRFVEGIETPQVAGKEFRTASQFEQ
jgi:hypothetical protein